METDDTEARPEWAQSLDMQPGDPGKVFYWAESIQLFGRHHFKLPAPGVTAIVGGNNAGKSTLLQQLDTKMRGHQVVDSVEVVSDVSIKRGGTVEDFLSWVATRAEYRLGYDRSPHFYIGEQGYPVESLVSGWKSGGSSRSLPTGALVFLVRSEGRFHYVQGVEQRQNSADLPEHPFHHFQDDVTVLARLDAICRRIFQQGLTLDDYSRSVRLRVGVPDVPPPGPAESQRAYRDALGRLSPLEFQGDGMKSLLGIMIPVVASAYPMLIIDEPEVFLHPPQAYSLGLALGELAVTSKAQIVLATHDRNLIGGLVASSVPLSVIRLNRDGQSAAASQLSGDQLAMLWSDPVLQYSNVLDGLFHRLVVVAEGERDCRFYQAALEHFCDERSGSAATIPSSDVLFVPSNGKDGMARLASVLRAAAVPVVVCPDMDILNEQTKTERLVEVMGGDWASMSADYRRSTEPFRQPPDRIPLEYVREALNKLIDERLEENPHAQHDKKFKEKLSYAMRAGESRWALLKRFGVEAFSGAAEQAARRLLSDFSECGVVPVSVGELEGFAKSLDVAKGKEWLPAALRKGAHKQEKAQSFVLQILDSAQRTYSK
ncbi:AAA family ATPase [Micromonospora sp. NPDC003241]